MRFLGDNTRTMNTQTYSTPNALQSPGGQPSDFAPGSIGSDASVLHFERGAKQTIERNRWFFISCVLGVALIAQGFAMSALLPLKTVETHLVREVGGGRLVADGAPVGTWAPDDDAVDYFLNQWAYKTWDINAATVDSMIAESSEQVVGTAKVQLQELRKKTNPYVLLKDYPGYSRTYELISVNKVQDDVRLIRFRTITRLAPDVTPKVTVYAMTVTFTRVKPRTRTDVMKNPAGLFITSFNTTEEFDEK